MLIDSTWQTQDLLQKELELDKGDLDKKWHLLTLEKIFIENKIYRLIENAESWDVVLDVIDQALLPFKGLLKHDVSKDDIVYLTDLKIKKISKYDMDKTEDKLVKLENDIDEVINNIKHIREYSIRFFERILDKYGSEKNRKTKIEKFDTIKLKQAALTNKKIFINYKDGFCGFSLKSDEFLCECSEFDDIIAFREDGSYLVTKVGEKKFLGKNIVYAGLWKKNDRHMIYNVVYLNRLDHKSYIKRFSIESILKDKEYLISKNVEDSKILYITGNPNSESEIIKINLHFKSKAKKKEFEYDFSDILIKSRFSKGNILTKYPVRKIIQSEVGSSTFGGKKVWFEEDIGKLNFDERGTLLGRFEVDDKILIIYKTGDYEVASVDLNRRLNISDIESLSKFNEADIISCLHFVGSKKNYYIKRFKIETNQVNRLFSFIDESRGSKFVKATINLNPSLTFNYRLKNGDKKQKKIDVVDFIDLKGWKALGNKVPLFLRMSGFLFTDGPTDIELEEKQEKPSFDVDTSNQEEQANDDLTLF